MALFRRRARPPSDPVEAVDAFWRWWTAEGAAATAAAIEGAELDDWAESLGERIDGVDPRLAWELGPGRSARHVLVVTAAGDPGLRPAARRWRRAAPPADDVWEYSDVRLPVEGLDWSLGMHDRRLDAESVRVDVEERPDAFDVVVHHPGLAGLPQDARDEAAFLLLDTALGETAVETWIGAVSASGDLAPSSSEDLGRLQERVRSRAEGEPEWVVLEAIDRRGAPVVAMAQVPLRAMTAPHLDTHVRVELPFAADPQSGLPDERSLAALRALEDHLSERIGDSGRVVAHETTGGVRTLHVYVDGQTPAVAQLETVVQAWADGRPSVRSSPDPGWDGVAHLRA